MKNKSIKIYFSDMIETILTYIIMMVIISLILFFLALPFYFHFINLLILIFFIIYFRRELVMYFMVLSDLKKKKNNKNVVIFDKIETDFRYGRAKRREFFKKYTTPRYSFYFEKELYRIGMNINPLLYNEFRGQEFEIEYLENSRLITKIIPLFEVPSSKQEEYRKSLGNVFFKEVK